MKFSMTWQEKGDHRSDHMGRFDYIFPLDNG